MHAPQFSEFYELSVDGDAAATPIDLSGASTVAFFVNGGVCHVASDVSMPAGERFMLPDMGGNQIAPFVFPCGDNRLWIQADAGTIITVYLWITKAVSA